MYPTRLSYLALAFALIAASCGSNGDAPDGAIVSPVSDDIDQSFDLLWSQVTAEGKDVIFTSQVVEAAGEAVPNATGDLDGAPVWSYVWPTSLDSSAVGFDAEQGILAMAATVHPDFDDTPLYDEDRDGDNANDGAEWHSHWVVLVEEATCGGGLTVRDISEGETPLVPATWPDLPILIDSPDLATTFDGASVEVRVPASEIGTPAGFSFDGVTSALRVSTAPENPLLCVETVFDVASGDLSLPGTVES